MAVRSKNSLGYAGRFFNDRILYLDPFVLVVFGFSAEAADRRPESGGCGLGSAALGTLPFGLFFNDLDPLVLMVFGCTAETACRGSESGGCGLGSAALGTLPFG